MKFRRFGYLVVLFCFVSSALVLLPNTKEGWRAARSVEVFEYDHPRYSKEAALKSIEERTINIVKARDSLTIEAVHDNLIFVNQLIEFGPHGEEVDTGRGNLARVNMDTFESLRAKGVLSRHDLGRLQETDPAWRSMRRPTEATIHWGVLRERAATMAPFSVLFILMGFAGLIQLWGLSKMLRVAWFATSFLLSVSGGAFAQTVKKAAGKKKDQTSRTLQVDARVAIYTSEGPPTPGLFLRTTRSGERVLVENVSTFNPRTKNWTTDVVGGGWIYRTEKTDKTRVLLAAYFTEAKGVNARVGAGLQIFRSGKLGLFALPVLRWERQLHGPPMHSFTVGPNPNVKLGSSGWSIAPDLFARKAQGKPWAWQIGIGLRRSFGKGKYQLEEGWLRNQVGVSQLRTRLISTFAY